jgi:GPH family glycoside/pentoside/hexuronide:cation symporter
VKQKTPIGGIGLLLYALPAVPLAFPTIPVAVLLPAFYAETVGLSLAVIGLVLGASRLLDVLTDPLVGALADRGGGRKAWIACGAVIAGISLIQVFNPPAEAGAFYLLCWSASLYLGWTMVQIPYQAWGAEASGDYLTRARIAGARETATVCGILLAGIGPALAGYAQLEMGQGLAALAWVTVGLGAATIIGLLVMVRSPPAGTAPFPSFGTLRILARNKPFLRLVAAWVVNGLATGVPAALFPFFVQHALRGTDIEKGLFLFLYFLCAVLSVPLWLALARRIDKHRAWCVAMIMAVVAFLPVPFLGAGDLLAFGIVCAITGAALGADLALPPAMQADVVDYGTLKEGNARAGLYFALWSMATKLALAASVMLALPALSLFGFDPALDTQAPGALVALGLIYAGFPAVCKMAAIGIVIRHALTARRHGVIRRRLDARSRRGNPEYGGIDR